MSGWYWSILISWLIGAAIVECCWKTDFSDGWAIPFKGCVSLWVGLQVSSIVEFVLTHFPISFTLSATVEGLVLGTAIGIFLARRLRYRVTLSQRIHPDRPVTRQRHWLYVSVTAIMLIAAAGCFYQFVLAELAVARIFPHGDYDAWQFWNLRARFIFREGHLDARMFAPPLNPISHPLLLPLTIVRAWQWAGSESPRIAAAISVLFGMMVPLTLFAGLLWLRGALTATLATMVLLSALGFPVHCGTQLADAPISGFMVAAVLLAVGALRHPGGHTGLLGLSGLMTGATAWTKNEGLLFCIVMGGCVFIAATWHKKLGGGIRAAKAFLIGAATALLFVVYFRLAFTTPCPPTLGHELSGSVMSMADASRHALFLQVFTATSPRTFNESIFPLCIAYAVTLWLGRMLAGKWSWSSDCPSGVFALAVAVLMIAGYYTVLLITPHDLYTLLCCTLFRLLLQLWPLAVLGFFCCLPSFADCLGTCTPPKHIN